MRRIHVGKSRFMNIDAGETECAECRFISRGEAWLCTVFDVILCRSKSDPFGFLRCKDCLASEQAIKASLEMRKAIRDFAAGKAAR